MVGCCAVVARASSSSDKPQGSAGAPATSGAASTGGPGAAGAAGAGQGGCLTVGASGAGSAGTATSGGSAESVGGAGSVRAATSGGATGSAGATQSSAGAVGGDGAFVMCDDPADFNGRGRCAATGKFGAVLSVETLTATSARSTLSAVFGTTTPPLETACTRAAVGGNCVP